MKTIKNFIVSLTIAFIGIIGCVNSSYARDYIDWSDLNVTYTYNDYNEKLDIKVFVDEYSYPSDKYSARFEINGSDYRKDFTYDANKDELYFEYSVYIGRNYVKDSYDMRIKVINDTRDDLEFNETLRGNLKNIFDWEDLKISNEYNRSNEYLKLTLTLENIDKNPYENYYSHFKIDGKTYTTSFEYSSYNKTYTATHNIYIDRDEIDDNYYYEVNIKNKNSLTIYEDSGRLDVDGDSQYNTSSKDTFAWENITTTNYYNTQSKELNVVFVIPNVNKTPSKNYFVVFRFNGKEYTKKLNYLENQGKLHASLTFNVGSLKDYYVVDYSIISSSNTIFTRENAKMYINKPNVSKPISNTTSIQKYNIDDIAQKIIDIAEERYTYSDDKIYYLERVTNKLENFFGTQPKYKAVLTGVNSRLKEQMKTYEESSYYEDDLFDLKYIDFR